MQPPSSLPSWDPAARSSRTRHGLGNARDKEGAMKLNPLFEGELRFDESNEVGFPAYGEDGDWLAYVEGDGAVTGARLAGDVRWMNHPRRRADGTWLPAFEGVITT